MKTLSLSAVLLAASCGGSLGYQISAGSASPVTDVFTCAREQLKVLDYDQSSIDVKERRITARRIDETIRRSDVTFRRGLNQLVVEVGIRSTGETGLTVEASTFYEYSTQRGYTLEQGPTTDAAKGAAQAIVEKCAQ